MLLAQQGQQLSVDGENFRDCILVLPPLLVKRLNLIDPLKWNTLGVCFPVRHEVQSPHRMPFALGAVARRLAAAPVLEHQRSRQRVLGDVILPQQLMLTLSQPSGLRTLSSIQVHLIRIFGIII